MAKFVIEGGKPLQGEVTVSGSNNAALPLIAASVLVPETHLSNVPHIKDVDLMLGILSYLDAKCIWTGEHSLSISTEKLVSRPLPLSARKLRASILFAGPLLARFGEAELPYPGGDIIGARPIDSHISAFKKLGARVSKEDNLIIRADKLKGGRVVLEESSVTATENIIMLASGISELVEIRLAAAEPHIQDLCKYLKEAGVSIEGEGTTVVKMRGLTSPGKVKHSVLPDELEVSGFAALAAATLGNISISPVEPDYLDSVLLQFAKTNVNFSLKENTLSITPPRSAYKSFRLQSGLYPKLVTDHLPPLAVLATQAKGATLVHDWLFEARQNYIRELMKMGANVIIMDPHRALILGPTPLYGKEVTSYDIRSGMAMIVAALVAKGRTVISEIEHIDRGYENLEGRLRAIGASIERVD